MSVTAHGVAMAYVLTTFFIMGFGYFVAETALAPSAAGTSLGVVGVLDVDRRRDHDDGADRDRARASVLYTFYPPLIGSPWFYIGLVLVVVGSWIWCALMIVAMTAWKRDNPGRARAAGDVRDRRERHHVAVDHGRRRRRAAVPGDPGRARLDADDRRRAGARALLVDAARDRLFLADPGLHRVLHDGAARDRRAALQRHDGAAHLRPVPGLRVPVGMHHLFDGPARSATGFKFIQVLLTALVALPTLLTIFTITASVEIAGRLRGGRGMFGWIAALPWDRPMVLAVGFSFVMLGFGGVGGLINMSYGMNAMIHNTSWVTAHFHLIFGGAVVIMYFAIAYEIWPHLTGRGIPRLRRCARSCGCGSSA